MVDPIGTKPVNFSDRVVAPVARTAAIAGATAVTKDDAPAAQTQATQVASEAAASAPVDQERVERIRTAIRNGTFPIYPAKIADRLLALKLDWAPHDGQ